MISLKIKISLEYVKEKVIKRNEIFFMQNQMGSGINKVVIS